MSTGNNYLDSVKKQGLLPLFYYDELQTSIEVIKALYGGGVRAVEYTNRGKNALPNFVALREIVSAELPDLFLGIGTIRTIHEAEQFADAGADFVVSPIVKAPVAGFLREREIPWIPGCMTPTEIDLAADCGATFVKLFPGNVLGPSYLRTVKEVFSNMEFMPTGGVEVEGENLREWFSAGAVAVGLGSKLITKDLLRSGDFPELSSNVRKLLTKIADIKG